jgi:hypothetical protein
MGKSVFQRGLKLHPLVSSPKILSVTMWDMFFTYFWCSPIQNIFKVYIMNHDALCVMTSFFVLYYSSMAMMIELSIIELMHYLLSWSL